MDKGKKRLFILLGMASLLVYGAVFGGIWFLMTAASPAVRHIAVTALAAGFVMLLSKNFCRSHHASLKVVVYSHEHHHQCHERFSAAHVALQEPVHLSAAADICAYLPDYTLLRVGQVKRQAHFVESVEIVADLVKRKAFVSLRANLCMSQDVQLHIEELLELQSELRFLQQVGVLRKVYVKN